MLLFHRSAVDSVCGGCDLETPFDASIPLPSTVNDMTSHSCILSVPPPSVSVIVQNDEPQPPAKIGIYWLANGPVHADILQ